MGESTRGLQTNLDRQADLVRLLGQFFENSMRRGVYGRLRVELSFEDGVLQEDTDVHWHDKKKLARQADCNPADNGPS